MAKIATKTIDQAGRKVVFEFANGERVEGRLDDMPREMIDALALHGLSQKGGDSYASAGDKGMTVEDCAAGVREIIRNLQAGVWSAGRTTTTGGMLAEALMRITGRSAEEVAAVLGAMNKAEIADLKKRPDVKAAMAQIAAERAAARAKVAGTTAGDGDDLEALFG